MNKKQITILTAGAVLLIAVTAGASVYLTKNSLNTEKVAVTAKQHNSPKRAQNSKNIKWDNADNTTQQPVKTAATCDDGNIGGKVVGGVGGGVLGSMLGKGHGKTATTIGGTLGGAYVGGEVIPLRNATCR